MTLASALTYVVWTYMLVPAHLEYLQTIAFILVIAVLVQFVEMVLRKMMPSLYAALGDLSAVDYDELCGARRCDSQHRQGL